jgi:hypothetical protein
MEATDGNEGQQTDAADRAEVLSLQAKRSAS